MHQERWWGKFGGEEPGKVIFQDGKGTTSSFISVVV